MRQQGRKICLFVDNFSGHNITYEPTNIRLEWFEPNLTCHVQPLDAGIIRCFKALYRRTFCHRTLELDDAGEADIYKINLLEAMMMANEAWDNVKSATIKACWDHTGIQREPISSIVIRIPASGTSNTRAGDLKTGRAWSVIRNFTTTDMTLPNAETALKNLWGDEHSEAQWWPALKAVMDAENDVLAALSAIENL
jgi:hypothetical protein